MGEVYLAHDTLLVRPVAIKVMRGQGGHAAQVERFIQEARAASALNHPNIVTIHEIIEAETGEFLMVQEFVEGRTLRDLLVGRLSLGVFVDVARQLTKALAAAHAAGIVHRDIKPENIMVRRDGYVKLLDFGVARPVAQAGPTAETVTAGPDAMTGVESVVGTPAYMSPEQGFNRVVDSRSDIFSLGIVFYEMLTGARPFSGDGSLGVLLAIATTHPVMPSRLNPSVPPPLDSLVMSMLSKEPDVRPVAGGVEAELALFGTLAPAMPMAASPARHIVGRDRERQRLANLLDRAAAGRGLIAAIVGEPGIGKTSLAEAVLDELERGVLRPLVVRGKCSERLAGTESYLPILGLLDNLLRSPQAGGFADVMRQVAPAWYVNVAPLSTRNREALESEEDLKGGSQERMKRELAAFLLDVSRVRPLVLLIEDLHWADASTVDLINYLAGHFDGARLLFVTTYRASDMALAMHPFLQVADRLKRMDALVEVTLDVLTRDDVERYLHLELPGHALPPAFVNLIHTRTEGHPLFMVDVIRYLREAGDIREEDGRWVLRAEAATIARELPETVRGTIRRTLDRLGEADRRLLTTGSVQGNEFETLVVAEALALDPADVEERCAVLSEMHRLVQPLRTTEFPDHSLSVRYRFAHVLYQNVLYGALQPTRRMSLAVKVAQSLTAHYGTAARSHATELAVLLEAARDFAGSASHFSTAASQALTIFGFREALSLAERGLAAARLMPEGPERNQVELGLQMVKGVALRSATGWATPALEQTFLRARELCRLLGDPPQVFPVLWAIALFHLIRGNLIECRERADQLMTKATESANPVFLLGAYHMAGVSREFIGEMTESSRLLERARELHHPEDHAAYRQMYGTDMGITARAMSARPLWALGYPDRALERVRETVEIASRLGEPAALVFALMVQTGILTYRGDADEALRTGERNIALCREHGFPQEAEWSRSFQGGALIALGRVAEGVDLLNDSLAAQFRLDSQLAGPMFLALLADGYGRSGRIDEGLKAVADGFAWSARTAEGGYVAELHRTRGELARLSGDLAGAEVAMRNAIDYARAQQARMFELRATVGLSRLLAETGRTPAARALLQPVCDWFTEGFETGDLMAARAQLAAMA